MSDNPSIPDPLEEYDGYEPIDLDELQSILDLADDTGLLNYQFSTTTEKINDWDVVQLIGKHLDTGDTERVAAIYAGQAEPYDYDIEAVANFFSVAVAIVPGLITQLMDSIDSSEDALRRRQTATFLAGVVYRKTMELTEENEELKNAWLPLLGALNVQPQTMDDYLTSFVSEDESPEPELSEESSD